MSEHLTHATTRPGSARLASPLTSTSARPAVSVLDAKGGRHAPPALRGPIGALVELLWLLVAWLVSLRIAPRHAQRVRFAGHAWPLRTVLLLFAGAAVLLLLAAAGAWVLGGGLVRLLAFLLAGRP